MSDFTKTLNNAIKKHYYIDKIIQKHMKILIYEEFRELYNIFEKWINKNVVLETVRDTRNLYEKLIMSEDEDLNLFLSKLYAKLEGIYETNCKYEFRYQLTEYIIYYTIYFKFSGILAEILLKNDYEHAFNIKLYEPTKKLDLKYGIDFISNNTYLSVKTYLPKKGTWKDTVWNRQIKNAAEKFKDKNIIKIIYTINKDFYSILDKNNNVIKKIKKRGIYELI